MARRQETTETEEPQEPADQRVRPEYHDGVLRRVVVEPPEDLGALDDPDEPPEIAVPTPSRAWATTTIEPGADEAEEAEEAEVTETTPEEGTPGVQPPTPARSWGITRVEPGHETPIPSPLMAREDDLEEPPEVRLPRPAPSWGITRVEPGRELRIPEAVGPPRAEPDIDLPSPSPYRGVTRVEPGDDRDPVRDGLAASAPTTEPVPEADFTVVDAAPKDGGDPEAGVSALAGLASTAPPTRVRPEPEEPVADDDAEVEVPADLEDGIEATLSQVHADGDGGPAPEAVAARVDEVLEGRRRRDAPRPGPPGIEESVDRILEGDSHDEPGPDDTLADDVDAVLDERDVA